VPPNASAAIFALFDFDENNRITLDEMTIMIRTCTSAFFKISGHAVDDRPTADNMTQLAAAVGWRAARD